MHGTIYWMKIYMPYEHMQVHLHAQSNFYLLTIPIMEDRPNTNIPPDRHTDNRKSGNDGDGDGNGEDGDNNNNDHRNNNVGLSNNNQATVVLSVRHNIDASGLQTTRTCDEKVLPGLEVIPIQTCLTSEYWLRPKACERKGVVGVMLSLRTATGTGRNAIVVNSGNRYVSGVGPNSRLRTGSYTSANYDRIVTFADCSSTNGACFAYMTHTKTQSVNLFENLRVGQEGIGDLVLLEEIYPISDTLGGSTDLALIKKCSHVLPLSGNIATLVPSVPLKAPDKGNTRYFCQHNVRDLEIGHVSIQQAVCGGRLWYDFAPVTMMIVPQLHTMSHLS